jgi:hypothetical protein
VLLSGLEEDSKKRNDGTQAIVLKIRVCKNEIPIMALKSEV